MSAKVGRPSTRPVVGIGPAAARASGLQVGWTPKRVETLRLHTGQRCRPSCRIHSAGTSPLSVPARTERQPRARAGSEQGQLGTGQKTRSGWLPPPSTAIPPPCRGERGEEARCLGRSPPSGVPGAGAMGEERARWRWLSPGSPPPRCPVPSQMPAGRRTRAQPPKTIRGRSTYWEKSKMQHLFDCNSRSKSALPIFIFCQF